MHLDNFAALIEIASLLISEISAHGFLSQPAVSFPVNVDKTQFIATIEASASGFSGSFGGSPALNTKFFNEAFDSSKYSSIKDFINNFGKIVTHGANLECGLTNPNSTPQPLPNEIQWTHSDTEGFTPSHEGPCEAWCDYTRVFHDGNCAAHFPTAPARLPFDRTGCLGANRLTFYWLALHSPTWQIYVNCAPLEGGSSLNSATQQNLTFAEQMDALSATLTVTPTAPTTTNINFATSISPTNEPAIEGRNETFFEDTQSEDDDCGSFDIAGDADDVSQGEEEMSEMDFGSHDVAGCENCGSIDTAGTEVEQTNRFIKSSLNLNNFDASYISSKVQPYK